MTKIDDGGPAFPTQTYDHSGAMQGIGVTVTDDPGMTLRDWFAGQALAGIYANSADDSPAGAHGRCAKEAYDAADAMLAARKDRPHD